jgi:hypothetical protein
MAKRVSRPAIQGTEGDTPLPGGVSDRVSERGDVVLKVLHTADWHLGRRFPSFPEEAQKKLSRARMEVITRVFDVGRRNGVGAVLCAGDLFDDPTPSEDFWEGLAKTLRDHPGPHVPTILIPGNHDPLTPESVWAPTHPFRQRLPNWVHVVDRDDFSYVLAPDVVLYAKPCRSKAGERDLAMELPPVKRKTNASASVACTAARSTWRATRRTFRLAAMPACSVGWTISPSAIRTPFAMSRKACPCRQSTLEPPRRPILTNRNPAMSYWWRSSDMAFVRGSRWSAWRSGDGSTCGAAT